MDIYQKERERERKLGWTLESDFLKEGKKKKNAILALNIINFVGPHCNKATK